MVKRLQRTRLGDDQKSVFASAILQHCQGSATNRAGKLDAEEVHASVGATLDSTSVLSRDNLLDNEDDARHNGGFSPDASRNKLKINLHTALHIRQSGTSLSRKALHATGTSWMVANAGASDCQHGANRSLMSDTLPISWLLVVVVCLLLGTGFCVQRSLSKLLKSRGMSDLSIDVGDTWKQAHSRISFVMSPPLIFMVLGLLLLVVVVPGVEAGKWRPWRKWPTMSLWSVGQPSADQLQAMTADGSIWMFGMSDGSNDVFKLDVDTKEWSRIKTSGAVPNARSGHSMTTVASDLYVFGGLLESGA